MSAGLGGSPQPALSVVMPSLNQVRYLDEAVASVMSQALPGGETIELVIQDGGSTDGSVERLAELQDRYAPRLRWLSEPDEGPADAIHRAVLAAQAPLIGWLNSDDLYAPGAVARAMQVFERQPGCVLVYGQGEHVDEGGAHLEAYPTLAPPVRLEAFLEGCFICQPTVFFRRDAYLALGGLDRSLKASFDFEFWIRLFKAHGAGAIGFVDALQASTRLHEAAITARQRERVAVEGMQLLQRHFGRAPAHWLLTHFDELAERHPFHAQPVCLVQAMRAVLERVRDTLDAQGLAEVARRFVDDQRVRLSSEGLGLGIHPDGWAGPDASIRIRQPAQPWTQLRLHARLLPHGVAGTALTLRHPSGREERFDIAGPGRFEIAWNLGELDQPGQQGEYRLLSGPGFVPALVEPGSVDRRELVYLVDAVETR